jgi:hypothetical protein
MLQYELQSALHVAVYKLKWCVQCVSLCNADSDAYMHMLPAATAMTAMTILPTVLWSQQLLH